MITKISKECKKKETTWIRVYKKNNQLIKEFNTGKNHSVSFNRDGKRLLFVSDLETQSTINVYNVGTDDSFSIIFDGIITQAKWYMDSIVFAGKTNRNSNETCDDAYFFEESDDYNSLYIFNPDNGIKRLTNNIQVWEFDTNGRDIISICSNRAVESSWYSAKICSINSSGESRQIYDPGFRQIGNIKVSSSGDIAFIESLLSDRGVVSGDILIIYAKTGKIGDLTEDADSSYSSFAFTKDGLTVLGNHKGNFFIKNLLTGKILWEARGTVYPAASPSFSYANGVYLFAHSGLDTPERLIRFDDKNMIEMPPLNSSVNLIKYPCEYVEWKARDGMIIYGFLRSRHAEDPLIVLVHGGPTSCYTEAFMDRATVYLGNGFSVFMPNYRGSTGMGRQYAESNRGDMGEWISRISYPVLTI